MEERWKLCKENNNYEVSNTGHVRNRKSKRMLAGSSNYAKYAQVNLHIGKNKGQKTYYYIRSLVASAFIGPCKGRSIGNIDGDSRNNRSDNLYYKDHQQKRTGWIKSTRGKDLDGKTVVQKLSIDDVCDIRNNHSKTQIETGREFDICQPYVSMIKAKKARKKVVCCKDSVRV